jgi:hypothetical protein
MPQPIPVFKYDLEGNLLAAYESINYAAKKNNLPFSCVRKAAAGTYSFSGVFVWSHERLTKMQPVFKSRYEKMRHRFKEIIAKKDEREIPFESISECARFIGCHRSAISQIINNSGKSNMKTIYGWTILTPRVETGHVPSKDFTCRMMK